MSRSEVSATEAAPVSQPWLATALHVGQTFSISFAVRARGRLNFLARHLLQSLSQPCLSICVAD